MAGKNASKKKSKTTIWTAKDNKAFALEHVDDGTFTSVSSAYDTGLIILRLLSQGPGGLKKLAEALNKE